MRGMAPRATPIEVVRRACQRISPIIAAAGAASHRSAARISGRMYTRVLRAGALLGEESPHRAGESIIFEPIRPGKMKGGMVTSGRSIDPSA